MKKAPAWLTYAVKTKAKIDQLPLDKKSQGRRERSIYRSFLIAREKHHYPGTLGDWEFVMKEGEPRTSTRLKISENGLLRASVSRSRMSSDGCGLRA